MNEEQILYIERLNKLLDLLEGNGLKPILLCGTLLAFIREGEPFPHDYKDIDIALPEEAYWKVRKLIDESDEFKYYRVWRREIAVFYKERKIDIFFLEDDKKDNLYIYSYKLNSFTGKYSTEWRTRFKTSDFYPVKRVDYPFLNHQVYIPNNTEQVLTTHYGDWKTPNSKWAITEMTNVDNHHRQIGFLIPTFMRPEKSKKCIESIYQIFPRDWYRVHVCDQENNSRYEYLHADDCFYNLEYNAGLAKSRQHLATNAKEPLLIVIDDDFIFSKESDLNTFVQILLDKEENGIVGGQLKNYNHKKIMKYFYNIEYDSKTLKKIEIKPEWKNTFQSRSQKPKKYAEGDLVLNFFMAKKEIFNDVQYDEKYKLTEHLDFFLQFKLQSDYKVLFTEDVFANHQPEGNSKEYMQYRHWLHGENVKLGFQRFKEKWGIDLNDVEVIN